MCFWRIETMNVSRQEAVLKTMFEICTEGDYKAVLSALKSFKSIQLPTDLIGSSPLHYAAKRNKLDIAQLLLNSRLCTLVNKIKKTPLHLAAQEGHVEMCKLLLSHGINVNLQDVMGMTALHWAVTYEHMNVVSVLMDNGADPNLMDKFGRSPLSIADANIATISIMTQLNHQKETKQAGPKRRCESSEYKDTNAKRRRTSQDNISGLNFLKQHGISYLPKDDSTTIATALNNGQTAVLTEAGKQLLNLFKSYDAPDRDLQRLSKEMISQVKAKLNKSKPKSDKSKPNHSDPVHSKTRSTKSTLEKSSRFNFTHSLEESIDQSDFESNLSTDSNSECNDDFTKKSTFNLYRYKNSVPPYNMEHPVSFTNISSQESPTSNTPAINSSFTNPKWEKGILSPAPQKESNVPVQHLSSTLSANFTPLGTSNICNETIHSSCILHPRDPTSFNKESQLGSTSYNSNILNIGSNSANSQEHVSVDSSSAIFKKSSNSTISLSQNLIEYPQSNPLTPKLVPKMTSSDYEAEFLKFCTDKSLPILSNPVKTKTTLSTPISYPLNTSTDSVLHTSDSTPRTSVEITNPSPKKDQARLYAMCLDTMTRKLLVIPIKSNAEKAALRIQRYTNTINDKSLSIERLSTENFKRYTGESTFIPSNKAPMQAFQKELEVQENLSKNNLTSINVEIARNSVSDSVKKHLEFTETKPLNKRMKKYPLSKRRMKKRRPKVYKDAHSNINKSSVLTQKNIYNSDSLEDSSFKRNEELSSPNNRVMPSNTQTIPPSSQLNTNLIATHGELSPTKISKPVVKINVGGRSLLVVNSLNKMNVPEKSTSNLTRENFLNSDNLPSFPVEESNTTSSTTKVTFFSPAKDATFGSTDLNTTKSNFSIENINFSNSKSTNSFVDKNILNATNNLNSNIKHLKDLLKNQSNNITNENINHFTTMRNTLNISSKNTTASNPSNPILNNKALNQIGDPNSVNSIGTINYFKSPRVVNKNAIRGACPSNPIINENVLNNIGDHTNSTDPVKIINTLNISGTTSSSNLTLRKPVRPKIHTIIPRPRVACKKPSTTIMQPRLTPPSLVRFGLLQPCSKVAIPLNKNNAQVLSTNVYYTANKPGMEKYAYVTLRTNGNPNIYSQKVPHLQNSHVVLAQNPMQLKSPSQTIVNSSINQSQVPNTSTGKGQEPTLQGFFINPGMCSASVVATSLESSLNPTPVKIQQLPISSNAFGLPPPSSSNCNPITLSTKQHSFVSPSPSSSNTSSNSFARVSCNSLVSTTSSNISTKVAFGLEKNTNNISKLKTTSLGSKITPTTSSVSTIPSVGLLSKFSVSSQNSTPLSSPRPTDTMYSSSKNLISSSLSSRKTSIVSCSSPAPPVFNAISSNATALVQETLPNFSKFNTDSSNSTMLVRSTSSNVSTSKPFLSSATSLVSSNLPSSNPLFSTSLVPFKREVPAKPCQYTLVRDCSTKDIPNFVVVPVPNPPSAKTNPPSTVKKCAEFEENSNNTSQLFNNNDPIHHNPSNKSTPNNTAIDIPTTKNLNNTNDYLELNVIDMDDLDNQPEGSVGEPIVPNNTTLNETESKATQIKDLVSFIKILEKDLKAQKDNSTSNTSPDSNLVQENKKGSLNNRKSIESKNKKTVDKRTEKDERIKKTDSKNCSVYSESNILIPKTNGVNYVSSHVTTVNSRNSNQTNDAIFTNAVNINTDFNRANKKPVNTANFHTVIPPIANYNSVIDITKKVNNVSNNKINVNNMMGNPCNVNNTTYNITRNKRSDQNDSKLIGVVRDHSSSTKNNINKMDKSIDNFNTNNRNDVIPNCDINDNLASSQTNINEDNSSKAENNIHKPNMNKNRFCLSSERTLSPIRKYPLLKHTNSRNHTLPRPRTADSVVFPLSSDSESEETASQDLIGMLNSLLRNVRQMDDTSQSSVVLSEIQDPPVDVYAKEFGQNENYRDIKYNSKYDKKPTDSYDNKREIEYRRHSQNRNSLHTYDYMEDSQNNQSSWNSQTLTEESSQSERQMMTYSPSADNRKTRSSSRDSQTDSRYDSPERLFAKFRKLTSKSRIVLDAKTKSKINNFISSLKHLNDENPATMSEERQDFRKRFALNLVDDKAGQNEPSMPTDKFTQSHINISPENSETNFLPHTTQGGYKSTHRFVASKCGNIFDSTGKRVPKIIELPDPPSRQGSLAGNIERSSQPNPASYTGNNNNSYQVSSPSQSPLLDNFDPSLLLESLGPGPSLETCNSETCNFQKNDSNLSLPNSSSGSLPASYEPSSSMCIEPSISVSQSYNPTLSSSPSSRYSTSSNGTSTFSNANISSMPFSVYPQSSYSQNVSSQPINLLESTNPSSSVTVSPISNNFPPYITSPNLPSFNYSAGLPVSSTYDSNIPPNSQNVYSVNKIYSISNLPPCIPDSSLANFSVQSAISSNTFSNFPSKPPTSQNCSQSESSTELFTPESSVQTLADLRITDANPTYPSLLNVVPSELTSTSVPPNNQIPPTLP